MLHLVQYQLCPISLVVVETMRLTRSPEIPHLGFVKVRLDTNSNFGVVPSVDDVLARGLLALWLALCDLPYCIFCFAQPLVSSPTRPEIGFAIARLEYPVEW
jgi:hypothetical protein